MKRRLFLRSLWLKGVALPSAYLLSPTLSRVAEAGTDDSEEDLVQRRGCGRTSTGGAKPNYGVIARDFYDPYLELIRLLKEASEIEHALMIQYIFGAFTLKPQYQELVGSAEPTGDSFMGVAVQEMQHLAAANKLLVALGSAPNLDRQDFPTEPDIYPFEFSLERLTKLTLARYTYVEAGQNSIPFTKKSRPADQLFCDQLTAELGSNTGMNHVPGLYGVFVDQLESAIADGTVQLDGADEWLENLKYIMNEGEKQHFGFFRSVFTGEHPALAGGSNPWDLAEDHPDYPSFPVTPNPTAFFGHANQIKSPEARALAWLSDLHYWIMLMLLNLYYRTGSEALNGMAQRHMREPLQSIAGLLAEYGTGLPFDVLSIGYAPAPDHVGNLEFILRLSEEADTFANKMKSDLPANYPLGLHAATKRVLEAEIRRLG
ncbi:MAG: ferritin-like domain-containing protein [Gammaproteobacteria bacterium]|jgi:hypothetical protein|nr:ferritin-like domain-containing protein [Gammaproteobacteria bacterium]MDP6616005.1 ferritin-like domain-containing protein [Gammaproteobacteria bacterium]MDP6695157.1 ferritin-like domain-containing protein [Gammaproteobacteria bacterium]